MHHYFAGMSVGIIVLQTAIVAPSMVKTLSRDDFGRSIRTIWPKFFLLVAATGVGGLAALIASDSPPALQYGIAAATIVCPLICHAIIPATNRATDSGDDAAFKRLHLTSVLLTIAVLLANLAALAA
ncbi:MAG: DUF4149 domain-containing protein [Myxococcota bacterium]|nr:DUF4149 domain-containing protein [Myxococcota bacterium]MEC9388985.1 DUF4149 domain-containing protein [Myxococcota bacterium]